VRVHVSAVIAVLLSSAGGFAHAAQTISSPPVSAHVQNAQGACYVRNVGSIPVTVKVEISRADGTARVPSFQNCNDHPLAPGTTCVVLAPLVDFHFWWGCSATASISAKNLRGTMEVRDDFFTVHDAHELR
jgi:hypothetical protein